MYYYINKHSYLDSDSLILFSVLIMIQMSQYHQNIMQMQRLEEEIDTSFSRDQLFHFYNKYHLKLCLQQLGMNYM